MLSEEKIRQISFLKGVEKFERVTSGLSDDLKLIVNKNGEKFTLRVSSSGEYEQKQKMFNILRQMQKINVSAPTPIEIGMLENGGFCYTVLSFLEGNDAKLEMKNFSDSEQYQIGFQAGEELFRMHQWEADSSIDSWHKRAIEKHNRYLEKYLVSDLRIKNDKKMLMFIKEHQYLLRNRPNRFQHDDFHVGNIIVENKKYAGTIDFGCDEWGDPYHDFIKLALFGRKSSTHFCCGQVDGYFKKNVTKEFWILYTLYTAMTLISSIVWSVEKAPGQIPEMLEMIKVVFDDHQDFNAIVPKWYTSSLRSYYVLALQ